MNAYITVFADNRIIACEKLNKAPIINAAHTKKATYLFAMADSKEEAMKKSEKILKGGAAC